MTNFIQAASLTAALAMGVVSNAQAGVNININIGDSGYWGAVPQITGLSPRIWYDNPVVAVGAVLTGVAPIYLNVPNDHRLNWKTYCNRYDACNRPVYFLQGNWYRQVYAPQYKQQYARGHVNQGPWTHRPSTNRAAYHPQDPHRAQPQAQQRPAAQHQSRPQAQQSNNRKPQAQQQNSRPQAQQSNNRQPQAQQQNNRPQAQQNNNRQPQGQQRPQGNGHDQQRR